jgi:hypothetical protein
MSTPPPNPPPTAPAISSDHIEGEIILGMEEIIKGMEDIILGHINISSSFVSPTKNPTASLTTSTPSMTKNQYKKPLQTRAKPTRKPTSKPTRKPTRNEYESGFSSNVYNAICHDTIAVHAVNSTDNGKSISLKYYPQDSVSETWADIIVCNPSLRSLYSNATEMSFAVPYPAVLHIPDKGEMVRATVMQTGILSMQSGSDILCDCGEEIMFTEGIMKIHQPDLVLCNPDIQMENNVVVPGQTLRVPCTAAETKEKLEDELSTFEYQSDLIFLESNNSQNNNNRQLMASGPQDGNWNRWDAYSCTHSKNDAYGDRTYIFKGSDEKCEQIFQGTTLTDGCSSPVWSAYTYNFQPACNVHDMCYQLAFWKDPIRYPKTFESRRRCDVQLRTLWHKACEQEHCNVWWKHFGECQFCYNTATVWMDFLLIAQGRNPTPGGSYLEGEYGNSIRTYSVASLYSESTTSAPRSFVVEDVFRFGRGEIRSRMNSKCLDISGSGGSVVHMWGCHGGWNQQWYRPNRNKFDMRLQADGNRCLDAPGGQGVAVYWHSCHDGNNQKWVYDDQYRLHNVAYPHLCLDIACWNCNNDGAKVHLWPCHGDKNQQWYQP